MPERSEVLKVEGIDIAGRLYLPDGQPPYPAVIICHGIPARLPDPGDRGYPALAERVCGEGLAVFIFNFRGAGSSGGNFDIAGWASDLKAVVDHLWALPEVDHRRLGVLGFSGGAAVSVYVAAHDERISALVTAACPAEFGLLAADKPQSLIDRFRGLGIIKDPHFPPSIEEWLGHFRLISPISYIDRIAPRPLLLVHGSQDDLVPVSNARRLYERAKEPKQLVIVDGAGHRLRQDERAMTTVIGWLKAKLTSQPEINYNGSV